MRHRLPYFAGLFLTLYLAGCVTPAEMDDAEVSELIGQVTAGVPRGDPQAELLYLDDDIRQELETRINPASNDRHKFAQLTEFLFGEDERNIQYEAWHSRTASETYHAGRGNCLSVSSLFIAAARHLRFDGHFETVEVSPSWAREGDTMIRYEHIVASGDVGRESYVVDLLRAFGSARTGRADISDEQALALFYSNLAVEALIVGDMDSGLFRLRQAALLWPNNSTIWSNLGTAYRRSGEPSLAEASYRYALVLDRRNYSALSNLTSFYRMEGREEEADQYLRQVSRYYKRNPYYHIQLAQREIEKKNEEAARQNLLRAEKLQRNDPAIHEALAESYLALGDLQASQAQRDLAEDVRLRNRVRQMEEQRLMNPARLGL